MSDEREIQEVLARYVRAADHRDGAAMSNIFLPEGRCEIFYNNADTPELLGELVGSEAIGAAVTTLMKPHPPRGWSHHTTHDPIIEVKGDTGRSTPILWCSTSSVQKSLKAVGRKGLLARREPSPRSRVATTGRS
jgi:hypothetical protein